MVSWFFVSYESFIFIAIVMFTIVLGAADNFITSFSVKSAVRSMLFKILEKITSYMLIFAVVSKMKLHTPPDQVGWLGFVWVSIFILDFVSSWFHDYSIYLAGPRTEKVSNAVEDFVLYLHR